MFAGGSDFDSDKDDGMGAGDFASADVWAARIDEHERGNGGGAGMSVHAWGFGIQLQHLAHCCSRISRQSCILTVSIP